MKEFSEISLAIFENPSKKLLLKQRLDVFGFITHEFEPDFNEIHRLSKAKTDIIIIEKKAFGQDWGAFLNLVRNEVTISYVPIIVIGNGISDSESFTLKAKANYYHNISDPINLLISKITFSKYYLELVVNEKETIVSEANTLEQSKNEFLRAFKRTIYENMNSQISHEHIAENVGMSKSTLYRKVKETASSTISLLISVIRVEYSLRVLEKTNLPVEEVAQMCGFTSSSYFIVAFKKITGYTPKQYKKLRKIDKNFLLQKIESL